jgi:hypothetical protein
MKSATSVRLEKELPASVPPAGRLTDAALERIVRRSRPAPAPAPAPASPAAPPKVSTAPVTSIPDDDVEPLSALFRAAARTPPGRFKLPAGITLWLVALGVAATAFLSGVLLGRTGEKAPPSGLQLQSTDARGTLVISWNYKAVQKLDHATLYLDDGGHFITVPLNHSRLVSGYFPYPRKFSLVTATMVAGDLRAVSSFAAHPQSRPVIQQGSGNP